MSDKKVLAFDFGASSGRAMLASFDGEKINMQEIHRFSNDPVSMNGTLYWDIARLFFEVKQSITKALKQGEFDAIGIDTWGVDFGLLDKKGQLLKNPVHYRDKCTDNTYNDVFKIITKDELYKKTGIQFMRFNTVYKLFDLLKNDADIMSLTKTILFMPDLFAYFLTGQKRCEITNASTSNLIDPHTRNWADDVLSSLKIDKNIFAPMINAGEKYGELTDEICEELGCQKVPVIAVATHDTASAVVSAPSQHEDFVYISCGTWSLFGIESKYAIITDKSQQENFTNELGYGKTVRFLKNIMGLWLIQESRRQFIREGYDVDFTTLEKEALASKPFACFIDCDALEFASPGNLPRRIKEFCKNTNQYVPQTRGELMRCIYDSLALKYKHTLLRLEKITDKTYHSINMVGGGIKSELLCQLTANACNVNVLAGPTEATVMGNVAVQLMSLGEIQSIDKAREIIKNSTKIMEYIPQENELWENAFKEYIKILK